MMGPSPSYMMTPIGGGQGPAMLHHGGQPGMLHHRGQPGMLHHGGRPDMIHQGGHPGILHSHGGQRLWHAGQSQPLRHVIGGKFQQTKVWVKKGKYNGSDRVILFLLVVNWFQGILLKIYIL